MAFALAGGVGFAAVVHRRHDRERMLVLSLATIVGVTVVAAWIASQISPAWTTRYFAVVLGPLVLVGARALFRAQRLGLFALVAIVFLWMGFQVKDNKENANRLAAALTPYVHPGTLVISTHPEQVPVLRYYLGPGLRWANTLGPVPDSRIFDWRDAVSRLRATPPRQTLDRLVASVPRGQDFIVFTPVFRDYRAWKSTLDEAGLGDLGTVDRAARRRSSGPPRPRRSRPMRSRAGELLQAAAGLRLSPRPLMSSRGRAPSPLS